jgi:ribosome-associated protein
LNTQEILDVVKIAYDALDSKQGEDIKVLDISGVTVLADYFIIAHGNNPNHVQSLIDETDRKLSEAGYEPKNVEGYRSGSWILLDYGNIIVHIFSKEDRMFYDLERMWSDGKEIVLV